MFILALNKKNIFLGLFLAFFVSTFLFFPNNFVGAGFVQAVGIDDALNGLGKSATKGYLNEDADKDISKINKNLGEKGIMTSIPEAIGKIIGAGLSLIGVLFLVLMIYAGFRWMLARGNETEVEKAKGLIEAAIAGLIIVFAAYAITTFIGNELTKGR